MGRSDEAGQLPGDAPLGDQSTLGERRRQHGRRAHQAQVAGEHDRHAHPGDGTVDRRDHRLGDRHQVGVRATQIVAGVGIAGHGDAGPDDLIGGALPRSAIAVGIGDAGEHAEIGAGTEAAAGTGEDDADDGRITLGLADRGGDLVSHPRRPGVELVGAVERDRGDRIVDLVEDLLEGIGHSRVVAGPGLPLAANDAPGVGNGPTPEEAGVEASPGAHRQTVSGGRRDRAAGRSRRDGGSPRG